MPLNDKGVVSPYKMKKSPIYMGTAAKPSPLKIWPALIPLLAKGAAAVGAKVAAAGGVKAIMAGMFTKATVGKAALSAGASITASAVNKQLKGPEENPNDPFGGQKMGV